MNNESKNMKHKFTEVAVGATVIGTAVAGPIALVPAAAFGAAYLSWRGFLKLIEQCGKVGASVAAAYERGKQKHVAPEIVVHQVADTRMPSYLEIQRRYRENCALIRSSELPAAAMDRLLREEQEQLERLVKQLMI